MELKFLILFFAIITFVSCDYCWYDDPLILGYSKIKQNEEGKYTCDIGNATYQVDSVLTEKEGREHFREGGKHFEAPILGKDVTAFTFDESDEIYFYKGHASSEEVKIVYFKDDVSDAQVVFAGLLFVVLYAWFFMTFEPEG